MMLGDPGMDVPPGSPSISYGPDGFESLFREWFSAWESWLVTPADFIDVDENRVLVMVEISGRSKTQGAEMPIQGANLLTIREGRLARLELFFRRAEALEAAGLSE
jgi:SnoaL-like domain